jgi:2-polyprenyl-3-methyl-5-hydroxy-6-metoxy-1,4-benzoquinol methylase
MDLYHPTLRILMRTGGRLSDGIRLGYREGFNSGTMVDYVYANQAQGISPLGRYIDRIMLDHPVWRGVRARRELLIGQLQEVIGQRPGQRLLDVAAGPGSYLFELPRGAAEYRAGDTDADERARGQARVAAEGRDDISFVAVDAFDPTTWPCPRFDILVASGFFDLLVDIADVRRLLAAGASATEPGAHWVLSVMEGHTDLKLLHEVLVDWDRKPWTAVTRSADEVIAEAEPLGWRAVKVEHEPLGLFGVVTLERVAQGAPPRDTGERLGAAS